MMKAKARASAKVAEGRPGKMAFLSFFYKLSKTAAKLL